MILNKEELELFLRIVAEKSIKAGIDEAIVTQIVVAGMKFGEDQDMLETSVVLVKEAIKGSVPKGLITTVVAEAFRESKNKIEKKRRNIKNKTVEVTEDATPKVTIHTVNIPQPLYGPIMPEPITVSQMFEEKQVLYGPPPINEKRSK